MAFPASRFKFTPAASPLALRIPAQLAAAATGGPGPRTPPEPEAGQAAAPPAQAAALEVDRVVPPSGNLWIGGQQVWLGPALAGRAITLWADERILHVLLDGVRIKTLPSRLSRTELARLANGGARPAGPAPLPLPDGTAIEVDRMVNGSGLACLAGTQFNVGCQLAGQKITLRMDGPLMTLIDATGAELRTMPCPVPQAARPRLRGARRALIPARPPGPVTVWRRVSCRGSIMVAKQKIHVGMTHARKTVTVTASSDSFTVTTDDETIAVVPRTTAREINRYKAYATQKTPRAWKGSSEDRT